MPDLKPCPFCGGEAEIIYAPFAGVVYIECLQCQTMMGRYHKTSESMHKAFHTYFETEEQAIEAWNYRSGEDVKPVDESVQGMG